MQKIVSLILGMIFLVACTPGKGSDHETRHDGAAEATYLDSVIPYEVADNYFVNNNIDTIPPVKIDNADEFDKYFGLATVMDPKGITSGVDFNTQYVINVVLPETDLETQLEPISLVKSEKGNLVFTYEVKVGMKQSYTTRPLLMIVVDRKYQGPVILRPLMG